MWCVDWLSGAQTKRCKVGQKGRCLSQVTYFIFFIPSMISMERLKSVCRLITRGTITEISKLGQVGALSRSHDLLSNYGIPSKSLEWVKLETSNLVSRLIIRHESTIVLLKVSYHSDATKNTVEVLYTSGGSRGPRGHGPPIIISSFLMYAF